MINGLPMCTPVRICIGVCTFQRPLLLSRCLASINRLEEPDGCRIEVVVVDNEEKPAVDGLVMAFQGCPGAHRFHYIHEPRRGISRARNAILERADEIRAEWTAMLDDDQFVPWDWLLRMWTARRNTDAAIIQSTVVPNYPASPPYWFVPQTEDRAWRFDLKYAAANGVLFPTRLCDRHGARLRFDIEYDLSGGEDRDFFSRAYLAGAQIVRTPDATASEFFPETKLTFAEQIRRRYWTAIISDRQDRRLRYSVYTICSMFVESLTCLFVGSIQLLTAPLLMFGDAPYGRWQCLSGALKIARAGGFIASLISGIRPEPFRTIHGG